MPQNFDTSVMLEQLRIIQGKTGASAVGGSVDVVGSSASGLYLEKGLKGKLGAGVEKTNSWFNAPIYPSGISCTLSGCKAWIDIGTTVIGVQ